MIEKLVNKIDATLTRIIGVNWRTTVSGFLTILAGFILTSPESFAFLPDFIESWVTFGAKVILLPAGTSFAALAKDSVVTGGNHPATAEARKRIGIE